MKTKLILSSALIFCFFICYAATDIPGNWSGNLVNSDGSLYPVNYTFAISDSLVTGTAKSVLGTFPIDSGRLDSANNFHFQVMVNGVSILHTATFYGDSIGMNYNLNGALAHCTLLPANNN